jgi:hypothetical protein
VQLLIDKDILEEEYLGCHPCVCTSSMKIRTADIVERFLPETGHEYQTVTLNTSAATRTIRIVVKAGDGSSRVYTLSFEVEKSANALLKMIYLDGDSLADFSPEQLNYIVPLNQDLIPDITVDQSPDQRLTSHNQIVLAQRVSRFNPR